MIVQNKLNLFVFIFISIDMKIWNLCTLCNNHKYWMLINFSCCSDTSSFSFSSVYFDANPLVIHCLLSVISLCCCVLLLCWLQSQINSHISADVSIIKPSPLCSSTFPFFSITVPWNFLLSIIILFNLFSAHSFSADVFNFLFGFFF